jgi:murein DD-endopeptidase MepM/ murein hydrolase activator NlpD
MVSQKALPVIVLTLMVFCHALPTQNIVAQTSMAQLQQKKEQFEKSIEYADVLINDTRLKKTTSLEELALLQKKIDARRNIIDNYRALHHQLFDAICHNLIAIDSIDTMLEHLKNEYAAIIRSAYLNTNNQQRLLFLLAADGFGQAIDRMNYYRIYAARRRNKAEDIASMQKQFIEKAMQTEDQIDENYKILHHLENEYALMENEIVEKKMLVAGFQRDEKQLISRQRMSQTEAAALHRNILETLANASQKPDAQAEQLLKTPAPFTDLLPGSFAHQRGKLPWPVATGFIIQPFGEHQHPDLKNIKIKNDGIDFLTQAGAGARAVFAGQVTRVMQANANSWVVIVRHDSFLTVYANLALTIVKAGQQVSALQNLGVIYTDKEAACTRLHFEVWNGKTLTDPMQWLVPDQKIIISDIATKK